MGIENKKGATVLKYNFRLYFCVILPIAIFFVGCAGKEITDSTNASDPAEISSSETTVDRRLRLSVVGDENVYFKHIPPEELGPSYTQELEYYGFSDVFVEIDGESMNLISAIQEDLITPEEIIAYSRIDARNGQCEMVFQSGMYYSVYGYLYENFEIVSVYDVYETTDGEQYHVESLTFGIPGYYENSIFSCPILYDEDGERINLEKNDWGITLEVVEAASDSATIRCSWTSGQDKRQLQVIDYVLLCSDGNDNWQLCQMSENSGDYQNVLISLPQEDCDFSLNWSELYGKLPTGDYRIHLLIEDFQENRNGTPSDYRNRKWYIVTFSIAE